MPEPHHSARRASWLLALFSFTSGLFFFGSMKLMSFHWISVSVLISFLLVGMPLGGFAAVRFLPEPLRALRVGLVLQALAMLVTLLAFPRFVDPGTRLQGFLDDTLEQGRAAFVIDKFLQLGLLFLPYFASFGLNEFSAYRLAIPRFGGRSEWAYALFLAATSLGYAAIELGAPWFGVLPIMLTGIAGIVATAAWLSRARLRAVWTLCAAALVAGAAMPGLEDRYLRTLEHHGPMDSGSSADRPSLYRAWGRYCHLAILEVNDRTITGFYNGGLHWFHRSGHTRQKLERDTFHLLPFAALPPRGRVLVIGAGGGEQVRNALLHDVEHVVAVEIIPEVLEVLSGPLVERTSRVYVDPRVTPVAMDGRRYLDSTNERFDLIYVPTVDTHISMMRTLFNSAETLYTVESFAAMRDHLTPTGMIVIQRPAIFDVTGALLRQYFKALQEVGLKTVAWARNPATAPAEPGALDLATRLSREKVYLLFATRADGSAELPAHAVRELQDKGFVRIDDFGAGPYLPKTDDFLFRSDMLFSMHQPLGPEVGMLAGAFIAIAALLVWYLRRLHLRSSARGPAPFAVLVGLGVLVGVNFLLVQQFLVYKLYRILDRPMDAMFFGTVGFLLVTGAGGIALTMRARRFNVLLALALLAALVLAVRWVVPESMAGVALALPLFTLTGALFPTLFRGPDSVLLTVFVADALGAAAAGVFEFAWPIFYGFQSYDRVTLAIFALTALTVYLARRRYAVVEAQ